MKLSYDPRYNIAYIQLREKSGTVNSLKISEEFIVDIGENGTVFGIELLNANEQLKDEKSLHLHFINEATGEEKEVLLPGAKAA